MRGVNQAVGAALVFVGLSAGPSQAQLIGTTVSGKFSVSEDGPSFFVPADVVVSETDPEFTFDDGANAITADFTANTLTLSDVSRTGSLPQYFTFSDSAFAGLTLTKTSDTYPNGGLDFVFSGTELMITTQNFLALGGSYSATFVFASAVPEPSPLVLGTLACLPIAALSLRRRTI